ncbi:MAG: DUF4328 domain-containing protein [Akkermansiaceae bacterium]
MSEELNPYETPKAVSVAETQESNIVPATGYVMLNTRVVGMCCKVLLVAFCALCVLLASWNFKLAAEYDLTDEFGGFGFFSFDQMVLIEEGYIFLFLGSAIAVAIWKFRSMKNAWAMMRSGMRPTVSPGWAVGWYFIPIAMFWKPFTAMSEINVNSSRRPKRLRPWLGFWWFFWVIAFLMRNAGGGEDGYYDAGDLKVSATRLLLIGAAGGCLLKIITYITERQMKELDSRKFKNKKEGL